MATSKAVGIDLGTTHSAVAWVDPSGRTAMIENAEGERLTPSVVLFGDSQVVVGKEARTATTTLPDQVVEWVKRDMGAPVYHRPIRGEYLPPEVIQACILRKLRSDIHRVLGPGDRVVITVPAYFDEPRRKATADAGEMAGLSVLDIVNEPVAAALAFGEAEGYLSPQPSRSPAESTVLVYDLGGGTFDVTLLRLAPGDIRTVATDGDVQLGGHDWDLRLVDHVAGRFQEAHGMDPREDRTAGGRLYHQVLEAKHTLSVRRRARLHLDCSGRSLEVDVTREQFEELTADLLERTAYTSRQLIATAGLDWSGVDRVLLVGGATRMPMVGRMLQELTGGAPERTVNPDEAVARGAALYAHYLLSKAGEGSGAGFEVTNVNSHSLGVEGIDPATMRKANVVLIPRNTPLPATFTEKFITKRAGQRSIVVQVLEGESSLPRECTAIGRTVVRGLPPDLPQGWTVEVTFQYAINGRLGVRAVVPGTHGETALALERAVGLSQEGIDGWKETVGASAGFAAFGSMMEDPAHRAGPSPADQESPPVGGRVGNAFWDGGGPGTAADPTGAGGSGGPSSAAEAGASSSAEDATPPAGSSPPSRAKSFPPVAHPRRAISRRSFRVIYLAGLVISALVGLIAGYLLVCRLYPKAGFPPFW